MVWVVKLIVGCLDMAVMGPNKCQRGADSSQGWSFWVSFGLFKTMAVIIWRAMACGLSIACICSMSFGPNPRAAFAISGGKDLAVTLSSLQGAGTDEEEAEGSRACYVINKC